MWSIRILSGPQSGQVFDLKTGKNIFGRSALCDFKVMSVGISKEHCEIHVYKDKVIIVDLKSSNGTFVNGVKVQNSILKLGDKLSLFDVIMDVIPTPDIRPKLIDPVSLIPPIPSQMIPQTAPQSRQPQQQVHASYSTPQMQGGLALQQQQIYDPQAYHQLQNSMNQAVQPGHLMQPEQNEVHQSFKQQEPALSLQQKIENFIENALMPIVYKLAYLMPFKHVLIGVILLFAFTSSLLSLIPMSTIIKESNLIEAMKRAKSVARSVAKSNEQLLISGQFSNLSVNDAMKEEGIKEALIIQQSNGTVLAPAEKAGRESTGRFIIRALKESRPTAVQIDSKTLGATFPIGSYDPLSGETSVKYHAVVYYDISSLNVDDGRILSLFMQTIVISSILCLIIYFLFSRLISFPLKQLNQQIDTALRDKTDRTEVLFDDPEVQKIVANVNLLLNRVWNGLSESEAPKALQNRDIEFVHMVEMISQPALVINKEGRFVSTNFQFEQLSQMEKSQLVQSHYAVIGDQALVQNIEHLIKKANDNPYEKHSDRIPFSQFECEMTVQACLDGSGQPDFYFLTLMKVVPE